MRIRLFGPVEVHVQDRGVDVGGPRQRCVLAALAVTAGRPVLADALIHRVWGDRPPAKVRQALYVYVARLRSAIERAGTPEWNEPVRLTRQARGYQLDIDPDRVDALRFDRLVIESRRADATDEQRAASLRQALGLWRDTPLADLSGEWIERVRQRWQRQHIEAMVTWADVELRLGNTTALVTPLAELLAESPTEEALAAVLMRAMHASGRTTEALDCYAATRKLMVDRLGIEPGPALRGIHQAILRGERDPEAGTARTTTAKSGSDPVPAQLPLNIADLVGRDAELAHMDEMLAGDGAGAAGSAVCGRGDRWRGQAGVRNLTHISGRPDQGPVAGRRRPAHQ
ncbi:AfsR/SARP family transcriptional regulator [Phytohabitans kaempferiae]|uniref:BTAD domain-containing putative transcriptional regulator n=1 Tax=Phytohabitans kaempferiae TaxID=1620943 RepID=A0ABV6MBC0_9ACTN